MNYKDLLEPRKEGYTDYEVAASIRNYRNRELAASDYTQLPDVDLPNKWDWAVYRQALRDMMQQNDDPKLIVFPEPPK
jgi:hypothetical protein